MIFGRRGDKRAPLLTYQRILVPLAGTEADEAPLRLTALLLGGTGGQAALLHVIEVPFERQLDAEDPKAIAFADEVIERAEAFLVEREVQVRTGSKAEVDIAHDPQRQSVLVNVVRPEAPPARPTSWAPGEVMPPADEPWKMPSLRRDLTFKPLPAVNAVVGYTAMLAESAPTLGSDFSGGGATSWGFDGHVPLGSTFNFDLGVEGLAYNVTSPQVKDASGADAQTRDHRARILPVIATVIIATLVFPTIYGVFDTEIRLFEAVTPANYKW